MLTRDQLIEDVTGKTRADFQTESSSELRDQIRKKEYALRNRIMQSTSVFQSDLPGEDAVARSRGKYDSKMKKVLKKLDAIEKLIDDYAKASGW